MTAVQPHAIRRRCGASHAIRAIIVLAVFALLASCKGSGESRTLKHGATATASAGTAMESAGEVVIPGTSSRYTVAPVGVAGAVAGTVGLSSPITAAAPLPSGRDGAVCGASIPDSSVQQRGKGLGNAVVWLEGIRKGKPLPLERRIELESDHCLLVPRVQAGVLGGSVNVIGHEDFRQHLRFIAGGESQPRAMVLLGKDEQVIPTELPLKSSGLVLVRDADHSWPRAYLAVFDHPYFAVTRPDGSFSIDQVPPGSYTLVAWHERTGRKEQKIEIRANGTEKVEVTLDGKS